MKGTLLSTSWIRGSRISSNSQVVIRDTASCKCARNKAPVGADCVFTGPLANLSPPIHFPLLRYPLPPLHLVCVRLWPPPALALSLSPHRHPFLCIPPSSRCIRYNKSSPASLTAGETREDVAHQQKSEMLRHINIFGARVGTNGYDVHDVKVKKSLSKKNEKRES
jgi:hypothetical protein